MAERGRFSGRRLLVLLFLFTLPLVTPKIRAADEIEYFAYLRSLVFDRDLDFENEYRHFYAANPEGLAGFKSTFLDHRDPRTGRCVNYGPLGSALLWSPFYLLAHASVLGARLLGASVSADGFSLPYVASVCYASALVGFLGLLLTHDALVRFGRLGEPAAGWAVAALWLGSPVLYYMTLAPGFSHAPSLFVVALLVWLTLEVRSRPAAPLRSFALLGAVGGLAGLVREQDLLFLAIPGLALLADAARRRELWGGLTRGLALALSALLVFSPQLIVYRTLYGGLHPSRDVAQKMDYLSPHFVQVLFDPAHSLFFWSPLLLVASAGLLWAALRHREGPAVLLLVALALQVWICGSISTWSQAGAFGMRRFIAATPAFAWGLAALLAPLLSRLGRGPIRASLVLFVWWNLSLMVQFGLKLIDRQGLVWPQVARSQVVEVPPRLLRAGWLFFTDRERLVREGVGAE